MSPTNPPSANPSQGSGSDVAVPPSPGTPGKFGTAPPPPYSEYHVPAGTLNSNPHASSSSSMHASHPTSTYPQQCVPFQHPNPQFAPGPNHQAIPVIVVQPSTPGIPPTPGRYHQFGPTPLNDRQVLLPYAFYTERAIVDARARWRFVEALLCAFGVYIGIALLVGAEGFGDGWWTFLSNANWATS